VATWVRSLQAFAPQKSHKVARAVHYANNIDRRRTRQVEHEHIFKP
jgi:hypothetical protein